MFETDLGGIIHHPNSLQGIHLTIERFIAYAMSSKLPAYISPVFYLCVTCYCRDMPRESLNKGNNSLNHVKYYTF